MLEKTRWNNEPSRPTGQDAAGVGVEHRPVERMRHLADQPVDSVAWQPGVGIERNDVADAVGHLWSLGAEVEETGVCRATQQPVHLVQLAALAFPTDPACFAGVPYPLAVQQQEPVSARRRGIALIESDDAGHRRFK